MTAIFQRLRDNHGYTGSYSAVRRYVHRVYPHTPEAVVRVHTAPGEELQVDFGSVGPLYDPVHGSLAARLCLCRHAVLQPSSVCRTGL